MSNKSDKVYKIVKAVLDFLMNFASIFLQQFIGTYSGKIFLKWATDYIIENFFESVAVPFTRVVAVKVGYKVDVKEGALRFEKFTQAQESGSEQDYYDALNDILR